jgi:hypothetical protein
MGPEFATRSSRGKKWILWRGICGYASQSRAWIWCSVMDVGNCALLLTAESYVPCSRRSAADESIQHGRERSLMDTERVAYWSIVAVERFCGAMSS